MNTGYLLLALALMTCTARAIYPRLPNALRMTPGGGLHPLWMRYWAVFYHFRCWARAFRFFRSGFVPEVRFLYLTWATRPRLIGEKWEQYRASIETGAEQKLRELRWWEHQP